MDNSLVNAAVARVILSTKRKNRQYSILEIANDINFLSNELEDINNVSKIIGISNEMLRQFLSVLKLPSEIISLVTERKIDSVSQVYYLSKYKKEDALILAKQLSNKELSSQDLRIILPYRKQFPNDSIFDLVDRVKKSKNIKVSVFRFAREEVLKNKTQLEEIFYNLIGKENLLTIEYTEKLIDIKVTRAGEKLLRLRAENDKLNLQGFIKKIIK